MRKVLSFTAIIFIWAIQPASACTMVFWNNNPQAKVVARSTDLYVSDQPMLVVQPRGQERNGEAGENSLKWKSKYGNVVITAFRTHTVSDGMNEKGLAVHLLYLDATKYEDRDPKKPALANLMWAQYLLDNFATVKEALAAEEKFQIISAKVHDRDWPLHAALEDATGDSAIIEYVDGKKKIYHGKQYQVMTNEPAYNIQLSNLKRYKLFGGKLAMPGDVDPLSRFVRAASYLKTLPAPEDYVQAVAGALSVIRTAMVPFGAEETSGAQAVDSWPTRWVTLADLTNRIYYFNSTTAPNIIWVDFNNINFNEDAPVLTLDPTHIDLIGEVSKNLSVK